MLYRHFVLTLCISLRYHSTQEPLCYFTAEGSSTLTPQRVTLGWPCSALESAERWGSRYLLIDSHTVLTGAAKPRSAADVNFKLPAAVDRPAWPYWCRGRVSRSTRYPSAKKGSSIAAPGSSRIHSNTDRTTTIRPFTYRPR